MNSNMDYMTPIKDITNMKVARTAAQSREGDWVCLVCNNLNFSFRKRCNRCKTQTRTQNDSCSGSSQQYSLYYYRECNWNESGGMGEVVTPQRNCTPERKTKKDLPSVSPLVRKYNESSMAKSSCGRSESSMWGVEVGLFEESDEVNMQAEEEGLEEMELLLSGIVL